MTKGALLIALAVALVIVACSSALITVNDPSGAVDSWFIASEAEGKSLWAQITPSDLEQETAWDPDSGGRPPLPLDEVARISRVELGRYVVDPDSWQLLGVEIQRMAGTKWVYIAKWGPRDTDVSGDLRIPVLFSGRPMRLAELKVTTGD